MHEYLVLGFCKHLVYISRFYRHLILPPCFREEAIGVEKHATLDEAQIPELEDRNSDTSSGVFCPQGFWAFYSTFSGLYFLTLKGAL